MQAGQTSCRRQDHYLHRLFYLTSRQTYVCRIITLCVTLLFTSAVPAQVQAEKVIEEIVVIGSHIRMDPEEALSPVTSLDREELRYQGSPTVLDMIINLPFSQGADGESDRFQGGGGGSGVGPDRATINIRGLGPSRSLVLINGRRTTWSPIPIGADTQLLVDVNMLPFIALENIDFLRDGAAASYGSDAIAGVMNFQTRSDFSGIELSANHKIIEDSGGDTEIGFIGGFDFAGRGHITTSASGIRRSELEKEILNKKREYSRQQEELKEDFNIRRNQEIGDLQKSVNEVVTSLAKNDNYDLVVTQPVLFASERIDLTERVLEELRKVQQ